MVCVGDKPELSSITPTTQDCKLSPITSLKSFKEGFGSCRKFLISREGKTYQAIASTVITCRMQKDFEPVGPNADECDIPNPMGCSRWDAIIATSEVRMKFVAQRLKE